MWEWLFLLSHVNAIKVNIVHNNACHFTSPVPATIEFQMGGTELRRPKWNQHLGIHGQWRQNVQGQLYIYIINTMHTDVWEMPLITSQKLLEVRW